MLVLLVVRMRLTVAGLLVMTVVVRVVMVVVVRMIMAVIIVGMVVGIRFGMFFDHGNHLLVIVAMVMLVVMLVIVVMSVIVPMIVSVRIIMPVSMVMPAIRSVHMLFLSGFAILVNGATMAVVRMALCGIGARLGLKGRHHRGHFGTQPLQHFIQHMVHGNAQPALAHLHCDVPIAQVIGGLRERNG